MEITLEKIDLYDILKGSSILEKHWAKAQGVLYFNEKRKRKYVITKGTCLEEGSIGFMLGGDYVICKEWND